MRFVQTSDWHLGRSFHGTSLMPAHRAYLDHLVELVEQESADAVLVSGDVYDRALPPPDAVRLLSGTLVRLHRAGAAVVISSGNHDSATRLGFASELLDAAGVHLRTEPTRLEEPVTIAGVDVFPLPYLEPALVAQELGAQEPTHAAVTRAALRRVAHARQGRDTPAVALAHLFAAGATTSDSERDIAVGGLAVVPVEVFDGLEHVALGHLHRPQQISATVRYSGSPVAMSFSEAGQVKGSLLVDLDEHGTAVRHVPAPVLRAVTTLRGTLEEVLDSPAHDEHEQDWVQVTLTDRVRPVRAMERVRSRFPHCLQLLFDAPAAPGPVRSYTERTRGRDDLTLCCEFVAHARGGAGPDERERELLARALDAGARQRNGESAAPQESLGAGVA